MQVDGALSDGTDVSVASGASYEVHVSDQIQNLSGSGSVVVGDGKTLTTGGVNDSTFSPVISGAGSLTKQGDGTLTLSGENTYTGDTVVNEGTLRVDGTVRSSLLSVSDGADYAQEYQTNIVFDENVTTTADSIGTTFTKSASLVFGGPDTNPNDGETDRIKLDFNQYRCCDGR